MSNSLMYTLDEPIAVNGVTYTEFQFNEPTGADIIQSQKLGEAGSVTAVNIALLGVCSGTSVSVLKKLPWRILKSMIVKFYNHFLPEETEAE